MNPQYETLAKCLLPEHMLEWFELTNVEVKPKEKKSTRDKQPDDIPVNVIHLFLRINACWSWLMKYANYLADSFLSLNREIHLKFKPLF